jgi:Xaa-Pro aminopeptidase
MLLHEKADQAQALLAPPPLLARLRGRKSQAEVERIRRAVAVTEQVVGLLTPHIRPRLSERDLAAFAHARFAELGVAPAWPAEGCPIVNGGPSSDLGHTYPSAAVRVEPGHLVHIDLGVRRDGYCSDLQRMWYVRRPGEPAPPADVRRALKKKTASRKTTGEEAASQFMR